MERIAKRSWVGTIEVLMLSLGGLTITSPLCAETPSSSPAYSLEDDPNLFVHHRQICLNTEFLYWTVNEGATDYALRMNQPAWGPTEAFAKGTYKIADYNWCPGFRVAVTWYNAPRFWETWGQYTWLYASGHQTAHKPSADNLFLNSTWGIITSSPLAEASSNLSLHYQLADLLVARVFDPNPHLRLKLFGGATLGYIQQKWKLRYENFALESDQIHNHWRYLGGGIRFGLCVDWFWTHRFYFTGKTSFATLMGNYVNHSSQHTTANPTGLNNPELSVRSPDWEDYRFAFHAQFLLGPSWQRPFECWSIEVFAGYEFNVWLNIDEVYRSSQSGPSNTKETWINYGVFGLQGLTARLTIGF